VGIVELDRDVVGELDPGLQSGTCISSMLEQRRASRPHDSELLEATDDVHQTRRAPEVLLLEPELLACRVVVVRVCAVSRESETSRTTGAKRRTEDPGNVLSLLGLVHARVVVSSVEARKVEAARRRQVGSFSTDWKVRTPSSDDWPRA
jgi:hypothetical protein